MYASPLTISNKDGTESDLEFPDTKIDDDTALLVEEFMQTLSEREKEVIERKLSGCKPADKRHKRFMKIIRQKARRFCLQGGL
jgi:hypothetical protein